MTLTNAVLLILLVLLIIIIVMLANIWDQLSTISDDAQRTQQLVLDGKARQSSVRSATGSIPRTEKAKVVQRHDSPLTGKMRTGMKLVRKGGASRGDSENNRLRQGPDEISGAEWEARRNGQAQPRKGW